MKLLNNIVRIGIFIFISQNLIAQDLFNKENSLKYATYLVERNNYELAIAELERITFLDPTDSLVNSLLINCYFLAHNFNKVNQKVLGEYKNKHVPEPVLQNFYKSSILLRKFENIENTQQFNNVLNKQDAVFYDVSVSIYKREFAGATAKIKKYGDNPGLMKYYQLLNNGDFRKHKNPGLSMAMSVLVPGSGKVYTGYWKDGVVSFVFIGTSLYQAYKGFEKKGANSFYGWLFGGISLSFYVGNVYGSGKSAHKRNSINENLYFEQADKILLSH